MQVRTIAKAILSRRWLPVTLLIVGLMALFVRLGFWQLDRLAQRRAANAALIAALEAQPLELNEQPLTGAPENLENRDVVVTGTFDYEAEIYLLLQNWQGRTGVHILTPLVMAGTDTAVLVDRGWIPQSEYETGDLSRFQTASDEVSITGYAALSQPPPRFADPQVRPTGPQREVYRVDLAQIAPQLPYSLLPIYVQQAPTEPNDATQLPLRAERQVDLSEGPHLSYAIQWFLFAALSGILFVVFIRRRFSSGFSVSIWLVLAVLGTLLLAGSVKAHGGGTLKVANEPIGAYRVSVWTAPAVPRGGDPLHVTVGVAQGDDGRPVLDTAVQVEAFTVDGSQLLGSATATTEQSVNKLFYEADLPAFDVGTVKIVVTVTGDGGEGTITFDQQIRPHFNTTLIIGLLAGGALLAGIIWVRSWQKQQADRGNGRLTRPGRRRQAEKQETD